ncbi:uroporphyrinogen-III synthase [mine drainage metagenome]|uniref:uroporphyrinogen-III synthase n=1 Tax=mine drainage metagenome TaxID=410659 RepID=A0A1J5SY87_9ZZZZ
MTKPSLSGRRIAITRASEQSGSLRTLLEERGAEVLELPLITVSAEIDKQTLADCMLELGSYDWMVFTSANGVRFFFDQFLRLFDDIRSLGLMRIACVGETTAEAVRAYHLRVECQPKRATAESLADALIETGSLDSAKILMVTGNLNRDVLERKLEEARAIVDRLQVYKTEQTDLTNDPAAAAFREKGADAVLFASSSAVESFAAQGDALKLGRNARQPLYGSIGPQTSESLGKAGLGPSFEARTPGLKELVDSLQQALAKAGS